MIIAVHGKEFDPGNRSALNGFFSRLEEVDCQVICSDEFARILSQGQIELPENLKTYQIPNLPEVDVIFSLGGDGTLLNTVTHVGERETPIVGINFGRLGYLATTAPDDLVNALELYLNKQFEIDNRVLLRLESSTRAFGELNFALNDFAILKTDTSSMITVKTYVDGEFLNAYWSDGLIISTPTGSTGYSLSCGGPLVLPQSSNFIITPISPHNLSVRPLVLPDNSVISFEIDSRVENVMLSLDSRSESVSSTIQLKVQKEKFRARLVKFAGVDTFGTLRKKLNWGLDARN